MTVYRARLTEIDIRRLIKATDEDERAAAAHKLCRNMDKAELDDEGRAAAQKILRLLADDAAELVRRAMAVTLKASDLIPHDVARRLAADVDSVALPVINFSPAFTDEDLIEIVTAGSSVRQVAVASRPRVGRDVASVLAEIGSEQAVRALGQIAFQHLLTEQVAGSVDAFGLQGPPCVDTRPERLEQARRQARPVVDGLQPQWPGVMDHQGGPRMGRTGQLGYAVLEQRHLTPRQGAQQQRRGQHPPRVQSGDEAAQVCLPHRLIDQIDGGPFAREVRQADRRLGCHRMARDQMLAHGIRGQLDQTLGHAQRQHLTIGQGHHDF